MSKIFKQQPDRGVGKRIPDGVKPIGITYSPNEFALLKFSNETVSQGTCLHCFPAPCMTYSPQELRVAEFPNFPIDSSDDVCATHAIEYDTGSGLPLINKDMCISCGLCAIRCPVGAIRLDTHDGATINDVPNENFVLTKTLTIGERLDELISSTRSVPRAGSLMADDERGQQRIFNRLGKVLAKSNPQTPNLLTRNLFMGLGLSCGIRRRGDVNLRMDGVLSASQKVGVTEVDLSAQGVLDSPRDILDSVAVLNSRYGKDVDQITPIIVTALLPNNRAEYWRVITDVAEVIGIKIRTLTITSMMLLIWNRCTIDLSAKYAFYADSHSRSIREWMEKLIGRPINAMRGILEALK